MLVTAYLSTIRHEALPCLCIFAPVGCSPLCVPAYTYLCSRLCCELSKAERSSHKMLFPACRHEQRALGYCATLTPQSLPSLLVCFGGPAQ